VLEGVPAIFAEGGFDHGFGSGYLGCSVDDYLTRRVELNINLETIALGYGVKQLSQFFSNASEILITESANGGTEAGFLLTSSDSLAPDPEPSNH
jgi:hypothetical protein